MRKINRYSEKKCAFPSVITLVTAKFVVWSYSIWPHSGSSFHPVEQWKLAFV